MAQNECQQIGFSNTKIMSDKEIKEKSKKLASRIRERIAMNQEDFEWLSCNIEWLSIEIKNKAK